MTKQQYRYRGSMNKKGKIGSARDFGNIGAGMVAARKGLSWGEARYGFDLYQGYSSNGITLLPTPGGYKDTGGIPVPTVLPEREGNPTVKAQRVGFNLGMKKYH